MIAINNLSFAYIKGEELFSSLTISVAKGERVLIIAPPGSGKTTLAKILTGVVPKYSGGALTGSIEIDGQALLPLDTADRMKRVSRCAQNTDEMMLFSTLKEELIYPLENLGYEGKDIDILLAKALEEFELSSMKDVTTSELSGGEKRRLMLAVLFLIDPELYVLDESFDELSPYWRERLGKKLKAENKSVLAFGSHYLSSYSSLFDRVLTIEGGRLVPYQRKPLPERLKPISLGPSSLEVRNIYYKAQQRSDELPPFTLSVPEFSLKAGEVKLIMGENGSGKSTFSKILCGLIDENGGSIAINQREAKGCERRREIAYLMQNPFSQLFLPRVLDELRSVSRSDRELEEAIKLFHLDKGWYLTEISYGRAKLTQAALFYLLRRPFVILDEIDSAMSYEDSLLVVKAFLSYKAGVLVITHDEQFASLLPSTRLKMDKGVLANED